MASARKESTITNQNELNGAASKAYHYICGVCNCKTKEEYDALMIKYEDLEEDYKDLEKTLDKVKEAIWS